MLALLGVEGSLSRTVIARRLSISPATVTAVTRDLLAHGLVHEVEHEASRGGRPAQRLALTGSAGRAIGVKVSADHVSFVEARLDGTLVGSWRENMDATAPNAADVLVDLIRDGVDRHRDGEGRLLGVGVAVPGAVDDQADGTVDAPTLDWQRVALGQRLRQALGLPVLLENDVSAVAVAERIYGRGRDYRDFLVVTIGKGIGAGLVIDGTLYRGAHGGAGEFGHLPVAAEGPVCKCGNTGCLEAFIGEDGLLAAARSKRLLRRSEGIEALQTKADAGNARAQALYAEAGVTLGRAMAGLVNVVDPEAVLVLGEGTAAWQHWRTGFEPALRAHLLASRRGVPVDVEQWDDYSWALGAAALVLAAPYDASGRAGRQGALVRALLRGEEVGLR